MKAIVPELDAKVNVIVYLIAAIVNCINMIQWGNEKNDDHLTRFKSMVGMLNLAGGEHVLVINEMIGKYDLISATKEETNEEK